MYSLSDEQIDFVLDDIKANGVVIEDLQHNLLDHICCIIENELNEGEDFYSFYKQVLPRFFKKELREIELETQNLLTFKNYYAMKNTLKISGLVSAVLTFLGATLKVLHLPGANISIVLGGILFSLVFLPLMIVLKFKDEEKQIDKIVLSFGFLIAMVAFTGVLFKLMHWPFANIMMISGISAFVFAYVPLYYITRVRRPELKFNTTINSVLMMACGGLIFALFNLGYSGKSMEEQVKLKNVNDLGVELISEIDGFIKDKDNNSTELITLKEKLETYQKKINELELKGK
jgi:hypothetical protein